MSVAALWLRVTQIICRKHKYCDIISRINSGSCENESARHLISVRCDLFLSSNSSCHLTQIITTLSVCSSGCACTDPTYINTGVGCVCSLSVLNYRVAQISITPLPVCHGFMLKHDLNCFGGDISARPAETARDAAHGVSSLHSLTLLYQEKRHSDRPYGREKPDWKTIKRDTEKKSLKL